MGRPCPIMGTAISQDCVECDTKECKQLKYKVVCIGIDQSYQNTGISLCADGKLKKVRSIFLDKYQTNSEKRRALNDELDGLLKVICNKAQKIVCVIERIRLHSQGFLNIDYIKSIGALNALITDKMTEYGIEVFSVDTRCWKSTVIGTSKGAPNKYGVPEEKWPMVRYLLKQGWENSLLIPIEGKKKKGTFVRDGQKYMYNNDAADSAGIALFWFQGDRDKLKKER